MNREEFFRFISPEHLYFVASLFGIATACIVIMIFVFLYTKKRRFRMQARITDQLNEWIGEALSESEVSRITVPPDIATMLKKPSFRQFAIDSLISVKKSVTGSMADSIVHLYQLLDLKKDSVKRFKSIEWYFRVRGIYELYMMQQHDYQPAIMKYTNSNNEYVRMEAQTAIIGFAGFKGLVFLDNLTHSLNEWQQLKLLEQLETLNVEEMEGLPGWLRSTNDYVVQFALKLAIYSSSCRCIIR